MAIVISGNGIDMGGNPVSNASQIDGMVINENGESVATDVELTNAIVTNVNTAGIALKTIATGTATFTATTNNINLTGIGIGVEIGDVIQISGAKDVKNNSEFTVEVITDANNIIVNQAHANKGSSKNVANRVSDTGVTVKLLAKWYNASEGLGQGWVNVTSNRISNMSYSNLTKRRIDIRINWNQSTTAYFTLNTFPEYLIINNPASTVSETYIGIEANSVYKYRVSVGSFINWYEFR